MLTHPTLVKLNSLRFFGMAKAFEEQLSCSDIGSMPFEERFALMVDREAIQRSNKRLKARLRKAKLKLKEACMEDIDYKRARGLDKSLMLSLSFCQWVAQHHNVLITGPCGTGKTYLACALAHKACLEGFSVHYHKPSRLLPELSIAKADGRYEKMMTELFKADVLILDDWGISSLNDDERLHLMELIDDRHGAKSTIITSQLPIKLWHEAIGDATLADAIIDRLIHNGHKLNLVGSSAREKLSNLEKVEACTD